jgi:signal transduction histidine kinase
MTTYPERVLQRAYGWMRAHPRSADATLGLLLLAGAADQIPSRPAVMAVAIVVNVLLAATVSARRSHPPGAFAAAALIAVIQIGFGAGRSSYPGFGLTVTDLAVVILLYTLAAYRPRRLSLTGLALCLAGAAVAIARYTPLHEPDGGTVLLLTIAVTGVTLLAAWLLGDAAAYRRAYYVSLEERVRVAERARDLEDKRARAVDGSAARLRRIERDLHDGAQVRLAALALALGEIKEQPDISERTVVLVSAAHQQAKDALTELRDLARGIHPPVLDRGLGPALEVLAATSAVPVVVHAGPLYDGTGHDGAGHDGAGHDGAGHDGAGHDGAGHDGAGQRPSPAIEAIAYFCAAELLANAAKHSAASQVAVSVREPGSGMLLMTVTDDGSGGARVVAGGGLAGLRERVQTVDGRLEVDSPPAGPTTITIELPRHA